MVIKAFHTMEICITKLRAVVKYINESTSASKDASKDFRRQDFNNRLCFFMAMMVHLIEAYKHKFKLISSFSDISLAVKDIDEVEHTADKFLKTLQMDTLTEDFANEQTVTISFILNNMAQDLERGCNTLGYVTIVVDRLTKSEIFHLF